MIMKLYISIVEKQIKQNQFLTTPYNNKEIKNKLNFLQIKIGFMIILYYIRNTNKKQQV